jgi:putative addiction module antidote
MNALVGKFEADPNILQFRKVGNSAGLIFPKELLARLELGEGDKVHFIPQPDGTIVLRKHVDDRARKLAVAREIMREYDDTMRELAK